MKNECIAVMDIRFAKAIAHIVRQLKDLEMFLINIAVFYDKFTLCVCNMEDSKRHSFAPQSLHTKIVKSLQKLKEINNSPSK